MQGETESQGGYKSETVSSPKFTRPLIDTPQTVTVIRKEIIAEQGAASLTDALRNTPGITFQLGENGNTQSGDTIFLRGYDTQNSVFLDGVRDMGAAVRDTFNLEQIEIFKGPAGADNGRGATSGYVNLVSKLPLAEDAASSSVSYGSNDRRRVTVDLNHSFDSGLAVRLNALGADGGVAGRDFIERQQWAVAPSIALGLGSSTRFYAFSQHVRQDNTPDGAVPAFGVADHFTQILADNGITPQRVDPENFYGLDDDNEKIDADMVTVRLEHDFAERFTVRNISRYGQSEQERILSAPIQGPTVADGTVVRPPANWTVGRSRHASFRENEILTNQTHLTANFRTGSLTHTLSGGVEFIYEKQNTPAYVSASLGTTAPANLYNPNPYDPFTVMPNPTTNGGFSKGNTLTTAGYVFDTVDLTPKWQLNGAVRVEQFDTEFESVTASTTLPLTLTPLSADASDTLVSWKTGVLFKPVDNGSIYVAYANSLKPPGSDNFTLTAQNAANINNPNLDPQKATHIEIGTKWDLLGGKLAATAAVFHSKNENDLARTDPTDPNAVIQYGEKRVEGVEVGVVGQITDAWQVSAGLTRQDTEVTEGQIGGNTPQTGAAINFSPKLSATLWTTYQLPFGLAIGGGIRYQDTQARQINAAPTAGGVFEVPSYTVLDGFASYAFTAKLGAQLNVYNLTDEFYVGAINNSGQRYLPGTPRSFLVTVNAKF